MRRLATDQSLVERLGVAARQFATGFTWERAAEDTEAHLREIVGRRGDG
jgi:hypothetical protein